MASVRVECPWCGREVSGRVQDDGRVLLSYHTGWRRRGEYCLGANDVVRPVSPVDWYSEGGGVGFVQERRALVVDQGELSLVREFTATDVADIRLEEARGAMGHFDDC